MTTKKEVFIQLTQGRKTSVNSEDFDYLNQWKWYYANGYAVRNDYAGGSPRQIKMHRQLMNAPLGLEVDHINRDRLDNRRENLRIATKGQNQQNAITPKNNKSGFKGVHKSPRGNGWIATAQGQYIGYFATAEDAAIAYNFVARLKFKDFARLNNV